MSQDVNYRPPSVGLLGVAIFLCATLQPAHAHGPLSYGHTVGPFVMAPEDLDMPLTGGVRLGTGLTHLHYQRVADRPPFHLFRFPLKMEVGLSPNVAMISGWDVRIRREGGQIVAGVGDITIATKVKVLSERGLYPAIGLMFLTKLPNARDSDAYLGTDATDFFASLIAQWESLALSSGVALLGSFNSAQGNNQQDDFATFSALWSIPSSTSVELSVGTTGFVSSRRRDDYAYAVIGLAAHSHRSTAKASLRLGLTHDSEAVGASFDFTFKLGKR